MSDFASLLGDLQKTAEKVTTAAADSVKGNRNNQEDSSSAGQKRKRQQSNGKLSRPRKSVLPRDVSSLSIQVSFMCIGSQKAGTSWLHEMLQNCPDLALPRQKEVHFWDWHRRKGLGWYSQQFPSQAKAGKRVLLGEVTPCYMTLPESDIEEIKALFPSVRIIFVARDLVERAWSALLMELRNSVRGMEAGQFDISDSLDARQLSKMEEESNPDLQSDEYFLNRLKHSTHAHRNDYASGLRRWLKFFPKEQLLILNFDDIQGNPRELLTRTLEHIGVKNVSAFVQTVGENELKEKVNATKGTTSNKAIRTSLRKQMEAVLKRPAQEMNLLLDELGYEWRLKDYI